MISAFTAKGDLDQLRNALNKGLDAGLTQSQLIQVFDLIEKTSQAAS